ncbi:Gfo/Idh/MocA family protein [Dissulfurirhabdus thermomarina]|nr:Gfo/Idh/MocA family oxidoreductase [Dissulfurirhabdus thermomarina]
MRVAVIGVGYLGRFHAQKYARMEGVELAGVVDADLERARRVAEEVGCPAYAHWREIPGRLDAVSVVVPTVHHHAVASEVLGAGIHCLLEKPMTTTVEEADDLIRIAADKGLVLQVGHLERFNPAVRVLEEQVSHPLFIEAHRLSGFKARSTDVDVVLDLMIHDLDIVLSLVRAPLEEIRAVGVPVLTPLVDIANVRLVFASGCTANLTASRISLQDMRRIRVFQPGTYLSADCMERKSLVVHREVTGGETPSIQPRLTSHEGGDILYDELAHFVETVRTGGTPKVSGRDGRAALELATRINALIAEGLKKAKDFGSPVNMPGGTS